jgi:hypothetical protein
MFAERMMNACNIQRRDRLLPTPALRSTRRTRRRERGESKESHIAFAAEELPASTV